ncbi:hypothetical protein BN2537_13543 [Streptomyces venezuelae]|nr:hypothetical protein BN2537_13543 [Streptomyces venezuelae]
MQGFQLPLPAEEPPAHGRRHRLIRHGPRSRPPAHEPIPRGLRTGDSERSSARGTDPLERGGHIPRSDQPMVTPPRSRGTVTK